MNGNFDEAERGRIADMDYAEAGISKAGSYSENCNQLNINVM